MSVETTLYPPCHATIYTNNTTSDTLEKLLLPVTCDASPTKGRGAAVANWNNDTVEVTFTYPVTVAVSAVVMLAF